MGEPDPMHHPFPPSVLPGATPLPRTRLPIARGSRSLHVTVILNRKVIHLSPSSRKFSLVRGTHCELPSPPNRTARFAEMIKKQSLLSRHMHFAVENKSYIKSDHNKAFLRLQPLLDHLPDICYIWAPLSGELESFVWTHGLYPAHLFLTLPSVASCRFLEIGMMRKFTV